MSLLKTTLCVEKFQSPKAASIHWEQAFCFFSAQDGAKKMDQELFRALCIQYFLSDDEEDPGNFVTGKTDFSDIEVRYTPTVEEKKTCWPLDVICDVYIITSRGAKFIYGKSDFLNFQRERDFSYFTIHVYSLK